MGEILENVNWLAVAAGTIASFMLGWLWYSPMMFGTKWAKGCNVELATKDSPMPMFPMAVQLVSTFLLAWLIGVTAASNEIFVALLILVTAGMLIGANGLFAKKSTYAILTEVTFIFAIGIVMIFMNGVL